MAKVQSELRTIKYYFKDIATKDNEKLVIEPSKSISKPRIRIVNAGCFEVADSLVSNDVVLHNFANNKCQGGPCSKFTEDGRFISSQEWSNTQEDQLVRRYRANILLPRALYPICVDNTPDSEALLYSQCGGIICDVITIPALQDPNYMKSSQRQGASLDAPISRVAKGNPCQTMINRIKLILAVCAMHNKILITGLWGCGAFGGKPKDLVELWEEALSDSKISKPSEIIFAIKIDRASSKWGTFDDMEKLFANLVLQKF